MHIFAIPDATNARREEEVDADVGVGGIPQVLCTVGDRHEKYGHVVAEEHVLGSLPCYSSLLDLMPDSMQRPAIFNAIESEAGPLTQHDMRSYIRHDFNLCSHGIGHQDCVGLCMDAGPHAAAAIVATMCQCACAPINPKLALPEIALELQRIQARAFIFLEDDSRATELEALASSLGIICLRTSLSASHTRAGTRSSQQTTVSDVKLAQLPVVPTSAFGSFMPSSAAPTRAAAQDLALLLHTSGSTGTPKVVPHTLQAIISGALCIAAAYRLQPADRCACIMPLFHVGGILRSLLAPLLSGGSTVVLPGVIPELFLAAVSEQGSSWYYAGPSIHRMIVDALQEERQRNGRPRDISSLRLVANAAGPLLHSAALAMRDAFGGDQCAILPSYGMTECMPISSPSIRYRLESPGTSGYACGPRVEIHDAFGAAQPAGVVGRIAIRGALVFGGYFSDARAPSRSRARTGFDDEGWFDTGDVGYLDRGGWLYVTGREKETINRGGETIAPVSIEEALSTHPFVDRAIAFATPHEELGETVGACLVVKRGAPRPSLLGLQQHCAAALQSSKWPQLVCYVDVIHASSTGKVVRHGIAERLCLQDVPLTEATLYTDRHFEAPSLPSRNEPPIRASRVVMDLDRLAAALRVNSNRACQVAVSLGPCGIHARVAPRSIGLASLLAALQTLPGYLQPSKIELVDDVNSGRPTARSDDDASESGGTSCGDEEADDFVSDPHPLRGVRRPARSHGSGARRTLRQESDEESCVTQASSSLDMLASQVAEEISDLTGVRLQLEQRLSESGVNSISVMRIVQGLKRRFPQSFSIDTLFLLQNPSMREIADAVRKRVDDQRVGKHEASAGVHGGGGSGKARVDVEQGDAGGEASAAATNQVHRCLRCEGFGRKDGSCEKLLRPEFNESPALALRALLGLWIMRSHFGSCVWREFTWRDEEYAWRVSIFFILAGLFESMKADRVYNGSMERVRDFVVPLYPLVWLVLLTAAPFHGGLGPLLWQSEKGWDTVAFIGNAFLVPFTFKVIPTKHVFGAGWYLAAQAFGLGCFNVLQNFSKESFFANNNVFRMAHAPPVDRPADASAVGALFAPLPSFLRRSLQHMLFARHSLAHFLLRLGVVCVPSVIIEQMKADLKYRTHVKREIVFDWHPDPDVERWIWRAGTLHMNPLVRLFTFYVGIVLGQGCLQVRFTAAQARVVGAAADALSIIFFVLIFWNGSGEGESSVDGNESVIVMLRELHVPILAMVLFGFCRAFKYSRVARLLSWAPLSQGARFTLPLYLCHQTVLNWLQFVRAYRVQSFYPWEPDERWQRKLAAARFYDRLHEGERCTYENDPATGPSLFDWNFTDTRETISHERMTLGCYIMPFEYISLTCISLVVAAMLTLCVHEPTACLYAFWMQRRRRLTTPSRGFGLWTQWGGLRVHSDDSTSADRTRTDKRESGAAVAHVYYLETVVTKALPSRCPSELCACGITQEQWRRWMQTFGAAANGACPFGIQAHPNASPADVADKLQSTSISSTSNEGSPVDFKGLCNERKERAVESLVTRLRCWNAGIGPLGLSLEALFLYRPLVFPLILSCAINPLYYAHWYQTAAIVRAMRAEVVMLGGRLRQYPGLLVFDFRPRPPANRGARTLSRGAIGCDV